jgi:hypothetical protein
MASLIDVATALATANPRRPSQPYLRRAVSTACYALFEALARDCAELLIGARSAPSEADWVRVFRALDHGAAKNACAQVANSGLPPSLVLFADTFLTLQEERHRADYDPSSRYTREEVLTLIEEADRAIRSLAAAPRSDRRTFGVMASFKKR